MSMYTDKRKTAVYINTVNIKEVKILTVEKTAVQISSDKQNYYLYFYLSVSLFLCFKKKIASFVMFFIYWNDNCKYDIAYFEYALVKRKDAVEYYQSLGS